MFPRTTFDVWILGLNSITLIISFDTEWLAECKGDRKGSWDTKWCLLPLLVLIYFEKEGEVLSHRIRYIWWLRNLR